MPMVIALMFVLGAAYPEFVRYVLDTDSIYSIVH